MHGSKVLILGAAGFIGSHLCGYFRSQGIEYVAVDNFSNSDASRYCKLTQDTSCNSLIHADAQDYLESCAVADFTHVIDLAYINGTRQFYVRGPEILNGALASCKASLEFAMKINAHYVYAGTPESYGYPSVFPTPEASPLIVPDVSNPRWSYAIGKILCENYIHCVSEGQKWKNFTIFRPFNAYGPYDRGHVIPELIDKLSASSEVLEVLGHKSDTRSFCYIDDMVNMIIALMQAQPAGETYNVGNSQEVTMGELVDTLLLVFDLDRVVEWVPSLVGNPTRRVPDVAKIQAVFPMEFTSLSDGLKSIRRAC